MNAKKKSDEKSQDKKGFAKGQSQSAGANIGISAFRDQKFGFGHSKPSWRGYNAKNFRHGNLPRRRTP